jgi:peptidase E
MSVKIMLGPQRPETSVRQAMEALTFSGPIVSITAGWRDSEGEIEDLQADIGHPIEDLMIYHRAEEIFARETELRALQRERQDQLLELQRLYRMRLTPAMQAARNLLRDQGRTDLLRLEQRAAISQVRALDRHHMARIASIHRQFDERRAALDIHTATAQRDKVLEKVADAGLILIAGGHVAVLLNRMRLFRLSDSLLNKPVIAWSAGAMVLGERIVLFHDDAPQGERDAEVLDAGLGIVHKLIPLPHAKSRLDWSSRTRMALFSRRFAPAVCCTLDSGSMIRIESGHLESGRIVSAVASSVMTRSGHRKELLPA